MGCSFLKSQVKAAQSTPIVNRAPLQVRVQRVYLTPTIIALTPPACEYHAPLISRHPTFIYAAGHVFEN